MVNFVLLIKILLISQSQVVMTGHLLYLLIIVLISIPPSAVHLYSPSCLARTIYLLSARYVPVGHKSARMLTLMPR